MEQTLSIGGRGARAHGDDDADEPALDRDAQRGLLLPNHGHHVRTRRGF